MFPEPNSGRNQSNFQRSGKKDVSIEQPSKTKLQSKIIAALAIAMVSLPVISVGIVNYYFDISGTERQERRTRRIDNPDLTEAELAQRNQLVTIVLISTGATALLVSVITAFWTVRLTRWRIAAAEQQAHQKREKQKQSFQEFITYLNQSFDPEEILETTVEEAQKILECDRVLIYGLEPNNYGKIIAEAVVPGWTRALGRTIADPCLGDKYMDKYRHGDFCAFNDIYEANFPLIDLAQLIKLEVKANLVVPIFCESKLFALLVAHKCSEPYIWQKEEIEFLTQLAERVGFTLNNIKMFTEANTLLQKAKIEGQWTQLFTNAVQRIGQSVEQQDILKIAVEEVRQILNCDRVVVYSLNQDNYGMVTAESVGVGWTKSLGVIFEDPCFAARYIEKYSSGRVKATDNIHTSRMTSCYLEQLEKLEVKANLVAPILYQEKLFGLLIAHQCSEHRSWEDNEINWLRQIAAQVGSALNNAKILVTQKQILKQAETEAQWTKLFTDTVKYIRQFLQQKDILTATVEKVRQILNCDRVVLYSLNQNSYGMVTVESVAQGWSKSLGVVLDDPCFAARYIEKYRFGRVKAIDNIYTSEMSSCYREQLEKLEVKANLVAPILYEGNLFGLLIAHQCSEPRTWQPYEVNWIGQIASQVGFTLDNTKLLTQEQTKKVNNITDIKEYKVLPSNIIPARTSSLEMEKDIAKVQATIAETTEKVKQINQASQKLFQKKKLITELKKHPNN